MSIRLRKIFFWILTALFCVTAVFIIPYALGYRFSWQRGIFVFTGSISVKANPQTVDIYVDRQPVAKQLFNRLNNAFHVDGLKPGEHFLEVSSPGFRTWSKRVIVNSGVSTEFWNVLLTRIDYPRTAFETTSIGDFFYDTQKRMAAFVRTNQEAFTVAVTDVRTAETRDVFSIAGYQFPVEAKENIEWAPKSREILIPVSHEGKQGYFVVNVDTGQSINLSEIAAEDNLRKARWDSEEDGYVYYLANQNLYRINISNPQDKVLVAERVSSYDLSGNRAYYLQLPAGIVYFTTPTTIDKPEQVTDTSELDMNDPTYRLTVYDERRIAFLNQRGDCYLFNEGEKESYFTRLGTNIAELQFSNDGKKLLFWNDWEIMVRFLRDWDVQPYRVENEQRDVVRFSEKLSNVQWTKDYEHVLFSAGRYIKVAELDHRDQRSLMDITATDLESTKVVSDFPNSALYFVDTVDGQNALVSIPFPEKVGIFQ
ncbi:hypothetical protein EPO05_02100 [Patescibacteria group bacterium]|nr:MAG: hypothetical protein EPO05_02100 [Patescibacteria group bacterium]